MRPTRLRMAICLLLGIGFGYLVPGMVAGQMVNGRSDGRYCCSPVRGVIATLKANWWVPVGPPDYDNWVQYQIRATTWDAITWESGPSRAMETGRIKGNNAALISTQWRHYNWLLELPSYPGTFYDGGALANGELPNRYQVYYSDRYCVGPSEPPCINWLRDGVGVMHTPLGYGWQSGHNRAFSGLQVLRSGSPQSDWGVQADATDNKYATFPTEGSWWPSYDGQPPGVTPGPGYFFWWSIGSSDWRVEGTSAPPGE